MRIGSFRYGWYRFDVFDDGSLASGHTWYEDPATAARELGLPADFLERETARRITAWAAEHAAPNLPASRTPPETP